MQIHFICNGNVFRSVIAETFLRSLDLADVITYSSGTLAVAHREQNKDNLNQTFELLRHHGIEQFAKPIASYPHQLPFNKPAAGDVVVLLNDIVKANCEMQGSLPKKYQVWHIADVGEAGRVPTETVSRLSLIEAAFHEITEQVNQLVTALQLK